MSCINFKFCANLNVISKHGVDVSIFVKCQHNVLFGKIDICVPLPPVYVRKVWDYHNVNVKNVKKATSNFKWKKKFHAAPETYRTLLNRLHYKKNIPEAQRLLVDRKFVFDFYEKANVFNKVFSSICTPIKNASILPSFPYRRKSFNISEKDILSILKSLDPIRLMDVPTHQLKYNNKVITIPLKSDKCSPCTQKRR